MENQKFDVGESFAYSPEPEKKKLFKLPEKIIKNRKLIFSSLAVIFIITAVSLFVYLSYKPVMPLPDYLETYRLVPEKISQSAVIPVTLPPGVRADYAKNNIQFNPEIKGEWIEDRKNVLSVFSFVYAKDKENEWTRIYFKPDEKLKLGHYYEVMLAMDDQGFFGADFLAVEDPEILAVFPAEDSEASEFSEITIVFNRPMVPLTTLAEMEAKDIPVEISLQTEGSWKWITTRNLQFIPEERLQRASTYNISIKKGFVSMEGLPLEGRNIQFTTRHLREQTMTSGSLVYNQPITISFNQPVDLGRTIPHISLYDLSTGKKIPFIAEYEGEGDSFKSVRGRVSNFLARITSFLPFRPFGKEDDREENSIIHIFNAADRFGRKKIWDFEINYRLEIEKVYPAEGEIVLEKPLSTRVSIPSIIERASSVSERTTQQRIDFFDPEGKIVVRFYEDIDLRKSSITSPYLKEIRYGEKCKELEEGIIEQRECEKTTDQKELHMFFFSDRIERSQSVPINFEKLVNSEGFDILKQPIQITAVSYPELKVIKTIPDDFQKEANLQSLVICTNSPLRRVEKDDWKKHISADKDFEMVSWGTSRHIERSGLQCRIGEFLTDIRYGLMPHEEYNLELLLEDVFSQQKQLSLNFFTGEMPSEAVNLFSYQSIYSVTSPDKTRLLYGSRNVDFVNLNICKIPAYSFLSRVNDGISSKVSFTSFVNCVERVNVNIPLPKRYWVQNYFTVDISDYFAHPLGHYIITVSHPNYSTRIYDSATRSYRETRAYHHSFLSVTNLGVTEKRVEARDTLLDSHKTGIDNLYWVNDFLTLSSVSGAAVSVYQGKDLSFVDRFLTNEEGVAFGPVVPDVRGAIITYGEDSTIIPFTRSGLNYARSALSAENIYLYTDKPIYQPSQRVFLKGIHRIGYDGNYEIMEDREINITVRDSRQIEIFSEKVSINEFGSFDTNFLIDEQAPLGQYRVCVGPSCIFIDVQEYVQSPFEVKISLDKEEYISKDEVGINVSADYFFGVPLEAGEITYTLSSQNYFFDKYRDRYFNFGYPRYFEYPFHYGDKFILKGKTELQDGKARISQTIDLKALQETGSRIIIADITVQNPEGQSISVQKSFIVHAGERYLGVRPDKSFLGKDESTNIKVKSVDVNGEETSVRNALMRIVKVEWEHVRRQEAGGGYSLRWERKEKEVERINFNTDRNGNYERGVSFKEEGQYLIEVSLEDNRGNSVVSLASLYVYGEGRVGIHFREGRVLDVEVFQRELNIGDTGEIIIKSPYDKAKAFITVERGKIFEYYIEEIKGNIFKFTFPVKEDYAPNVFVSILLQSAEAEVRFASEKFNINSERHEISIEIKTDKESYLPGEEVRLELTATDYRGRPVEGEFSLAVVDLSILALKGNPKKNPLAFFYQGFPLTIRTSSNIANILIEHPIPTKGGAGFAVLEEKPRGDFRETAFWQANILTDSNGKAYVDFRLPDNLTRWQAETVGVTKETQLGIAYQEFTVRKNLMVVPLFPRFMIPGDILLIGARVFNQSESRQRINVLFESDTLELIDRESGVVNLGAGESTVVYFKVRAPESILNGRHNFTVSAKSDSYEDTVIHSVPINHPYVYEAVSSAYATSQNTAREYVFVPGNVIMDRGELSVSVSATLAVFFSEALNYLIDFPYGCAEQIASRINAIAIVKKGLNLPNVEEKLQLEPIEYKGREVSIDELVEIGMAELMNYRTRDNGFSMWKGGRSNFHVTLYVIEALHNLKKAGYKINEEALNGAADYVFKEVTTNRLIYQNQNNVINAAYHLLSLPKYRYNPSLIGMIDRIVNDERFIKDRASNNTLSQLAVIVAGDFPASARNYIFNTVDNRLNVDSRGAFLPLNENFLWYNFETSVKNTALYLKAISLSQKEHHFSDNIIRWLINSRTQDGSWGSTNNTLAAIDALTEYLLWKKETESNFMLDVSLNTVSRGEFTFDPETIFDRQRIVTPLQNLKVNTINNLLFSKTNHNEMENKFYYDMVLRYYLPVEQAPPRDEGFSVTRSYFQIDDKENKNPLQRAKVGDVLRVSLQVTVPVERKHVIVEDFIPAGFEIINLELATEQKSLRLQDREIENRELRPDHTELRNDRAFLYTEHLSAGLYEFDYYVRALIPGEFVHLPVTASEMYFPENFGRSSGGYFTITR